MSTSSRRLSQMMRESRPSQTKGKEKGGSCVKSDLKEFGRSANPYKLSGDKLNRYREYCSHTDGLNK
jgi:hypothetical protein